MDRLGFYYNMNSCVGCGGCQVACKEAHGLKPDEFFRRVAMLESGPFSGGCNHCLDAACVAACPTGATYKAEDGTTRRDDGKCIGCGACTWSCPYGAISFSKTRGVTQKCDSCAERRAQGLEPACVAACPTGSLKFGPLKETGAELSFLPDPKKTDASLFVKLSKRIRGADSHISRSETDLAEVERHE